MSGDDPTRKRPARRPFGGRGLEPDAALGTTAPLARGAGAGPALPFARSPVIAAEAPRAAAAPTGRSERLIEMLWFDPRVAPRLRRHPGWRAIVDAMEAEADLDLEAGQPGGDDRRSAFEVIARAPATPSEALVTSLAEAIRGDGKFLAPLVAIAGTMLLPGDPVARLSLACAAFEPHGAENPAVRQATAAVRPYLEHPDSLALVADSLYDQLAATVRGQLRNAADLERAVSRLLVERRAHQVRDVFGEPHVRCLLAAGPEPHVTLYLPLPAARMLPLAAQLDVRVIAEVHPRVDETEPHPCALRARCVAREIARPVTRR